MSSTITRRGFLGKLAKGGAVVGAAAVGLALTTEDAEAATTHTGKYAGYEGGSFFFDRKFTGRQGYRSKADLSRLKIGTLYTYEVKGVPGDYSIIRVY